MYHLYKITTCCQCLHDKSSDKHFTMIFLIYFSTWISGSLMAEDNNSPEKGLSAVDYGIRPIQTGDIALIFYLTLANEGDSTYHVSVRMKQCVETVDNEQDYESMHLMGGDMGTIAGHSTENVTLIFPNLHLYNRIGTCTVVVDYEDVKQPGKTSQLVRDIAFNTTKYYCTDGLQEAKRCESPDLDIENNCAPVDCRMKYSGSRSFFNKHTKRCNEVPCCIANLDLPDPDVAYNPINNQCKNMKSLVTKADLELLEYNNYKDCGFEFAYPQRNCHHGYLSNYTGECVCAPGWITSLEDSYEPGLGIYHSCNVEINGWVNINKSRIKVTALLVAIFAVTIASKILIIMCILNMCFKWAKSSKNAKADASPGEKPPEESNEELIKKSSQQSSLKSSLKSSKQSQAAEETTDENKPTQAYACSAVFVENPFVVQTSDKSDASTVTSSADEIHIYVERDSKSNTDDTTESASTNTDYTIEFSEEGEDDPEMLRHNTSRVSSSIDHKGHVTDVQEKTTTSGLVSRRPSSEMHSTERRSSERRSSGRRSNESNRPSL